jgi:hypothetical protein
MALQGRPENGFFLIATKLEDLLNLPPKFDRLEKKVDRIEEDFSKLRDDVNCYVKKMYAKNCQKI